jgi:hypothetical protein
MLDYLVPAPKEVKLLDRKTPRPKTARLQLQPGVDPAWPEIARFADDLLNICGLDAAPPAGQGTPIILAIASQGLLPEGYKLSIREAAITLIGADRRGLFYAIQTLLQVLAFSGDELDLLDIADAPALQARELMLDLARAPFSMPLLKRCIRIMARLKLNTLHLHLFDDQLNSLRFEKLPLGRENPWALSLDQLRQVIAYARSYHIAVVPELEFWGHAGSILHHYPHLYGAPGMWGGYSFGIGEELYPLLEQILDEVVPVLDSPCDVHLGLDEAIWATLPSVKEADKLKYTPETHVGRLHDILQNVADRHGKQVRMRIWADHGGRPIPETIRDKVVVEPWQYFEAKEADIREKVAKFAGPGKPPFMMGGGMSSLHLQGTYGATRIWCQAGCVHPNCEGVDICFWESNDVAGHLLGIYAGAGFAWNPQAQITRDNDHLGEWVRGMYLRRMKRWQQAFRDADEAALRLDTGPTVHNGLYTDGPLAGEPVALTALLKHPQNRAEAAGG